jgi:hypothetical protein
MKNKVIKLLEDNKKPINDYYGTEGIIDDEFEDIAQEIVKLFAIPVVINSKIIDWKCPEEETPLVYLTGAWDGKNSNQVIAEDINGKKYIAHYCKGFMDGSSFADWYNSDDYWIKEEIVRWLPIPK